MARKQTCTYHCATCNAHFHSLEGFDYHRPGDCNLDARSEKTGKPLLEAWTTDGWCFIQDKSPKEGFHPVTIYTRAGFSQRREALEARKGAR